MRLATPSLWRAQARPCPPGRGRTALALKSSRPASTAFLTALCYGPEFAGRPLDQWPYLNGVELDFSRPGTPTDKCVHRSPQRPHAG